MRIAIHSSPNSFSNRWIAYCKLKKIDYKIVNCYSTDIIRQLSDCDALMWHFHHEDYKDALFAKQLLFAVELSGKKVFPDFRTCWHFDDKVAQKYLLESLDVPFVPSYVFYSKSDALKWIKSATFPKVFKLRGGGASRNVRLVESARNAEKLVRIAFGSGFSQSDRIAYIKEKWRQYVDLKKDFSVVVKAFGRFFIPNEFTRMYHKEKGYVLFQDFIPGNRFDIRVIVIDEKAFALKRMVRKNDFRASGSGMIVYEKDNFSDEIIRMSFQLAEKLQSQSTAFDFVFDEKNRPLLVEISYGFLVEAYDSCVGYWDADLRFHEGAFNPQHWMVDSLMKQK
jgi:glutathione synthase/RimK-type ligase-like ATP-grasp enzyme